jgi:putative membrane protein
MEYLNLKALTASLIYSLLGILILVVSFYIVERLTPQTLWKEIMDAAQHGPGYRGGGFHAGHCHDYQRGHSWLSCWIARRK